MKYATPLLPITAALLFALLWNACGADLQNQKNHGRLMNPNDPALKDLPRATLGGGCFWCLEAVFQRIDGVKAVQSGYTGGYLENPTYLDVVTGETGHAEVVQITFDPSVLSYEDILDVFWAAHDPTTLNRQGADVGTQYRSAIFYADPSQKEIAERSKAKAAAQFPNPIVTEIVPLGTFYPAEDYHQNYYNQNPNAGYCRYVIHPKLRKLGLED